MIEGHEPSDVITALFGKRVCLVRSRMRHLCCVCSEIWIMMIGEAISKLLLEIIPLNAARIVKLSPELLINSPLHMQKMSARPAIHITCFTRCPISFHNSQWNILNVCWKRKGVLKLIKSPLAAG